LIDFVLLYLPAALECHQANEQQANAATNPPPQFPENTNARFCPQSLSPCRWPSPIDPNSTFDHDGDPIRKGPRSKDVPQATSSVPPGPIWGPVMRVMGVNVDSNRQILLCADPTSIPFNIPIGVNRTGLGCPNSPPAPVGGKSRQIDIL